MKALLIVLFSVSIFSATAFTQKISEDDVPPTIVKAFNHKFHETKKVKWEMEDSGYEVKFKMKGNKMSANFDKDGKWLETETEIDTDKLPSAIRSVLKKEFTEFKVQEASKIQNAKDGNFYEADIKKGKESFTLIFAPDGKVISKKSNNEDDAKEGKDEKEEKEKK